MWWAMWNTKSASNCIGTNLKCFARTHNSPYTTLIHTRAHIPYVLYSDFLFALIHFGTWSVRPYKMRNAHAAFKHIVSLYSFHTCYMNSIVCPYVRLLVCWLTIFVACIIHRKFVNWMNQDEEEEKMLSATEIADQINEITHGAAVFFFFFWHSTTIWC